MSESHIAVAFAQRAVRASLPSAQDPIDRAAIISGLHHTINHEAMELGADIVATLNGHAQAAAILIVDRCKDDDGARALLKSANALAAAQLEMMIGLRRAAQVQREATEAPNNQGSGQ